VAESSDVLSNRSEVHYFDSKGAPADEGVAGGGFVITNAKLGLKTVTLKMKKKDKYRTKLVYGSKNSIAIF